MTLSAVEKIRRETVSQLNGKKAVFGFSGGVDSTTIATILAPELKDQLTIVVIDAGHLRENELIEIKKHAQWAGVKNNIRIVYAQEEFLKKIGRTTDAEEKRKRFKEAYASVFINVAKEVGAEVVIQGTLATDIDESKKTKNFIKSHHNVGLDMDLAQIHPLKDFYKHEVRRISREIGLPESVFNREPFPGPGLFLRVVGTPITSKKLDIVRWADNETREQLKLSNVNVSQLVVAYIGIKTVGIKNSSRAYGGSIIVRAVNTKDFKTAKGVYFSKAVAGKIMGRLTKHPDVVRVWFDSTNKPPGTTEME